MINKNRKLLQDIIEESFKNLKYFPKINKFLDFLLERNKSLNLISRKMDETTIIKEHIYDCLDAWKYFKPYEIITDLGTGGGFPGILLSIIFPQKKIIMIEKSIKKSKYLRDLLVFLNLKNSYIENEIASEIKLKTDVVTARAFKPLLEIIKFTKEYFFAHGKYILYKGREDTIDKEINNAKSSFNFKYDIVKIAEKIEKERNLLFIHR